MQLFSAMPSQDMNLAEREIGTIVVPYWIRKVFDRNKLDYIDILNYDKLRSILSIEDMAQFICLTNHFKDVTLSKLSSFSYTVSERWNETRSEKNSAEYYDVICPLASSDAVASAVFDRLKDESRKVEVICVDDTIGQISLLKINGEDTTEWPFKVTAFRDRFVLVFLDQGILNTFEVRDGRFKFISEYLRALYSLTSIRNVSKYYDAFEHYFNLL